MKTRQGLKHLVIRGGNSRPYTSCSGLENPTGIETYCDCDGDPITPSVAADLKTRQGLKLSIYDNVKSIRAYGCSGLENPTGIETVRSVGSYKGGYDVAADLKTRQGLKPCKLSLMAAKKVPLQRT